MHQGSYTYACVKECCVVDATKKEVVFVSITSTKTHEVGKFLICERKSSDRYASSSQLFCEMILLSTIFQGSHHRFCQ